MAKKDLKITKGLHNGEGIPLYESCLHLIETNEGMDVLVTNKEGVYLSITRNDVKIISNFLNKMLEE